MYSKAQDDAIVAGCNYCKAYASHGSMQALGKACDQPTPKRLEKWRYLLRGKHPKLPLTVSPDANPDLS